MSDENVAFWIQPTYCASGSVWNLAGRRQAVFWHAPRVCVVRPGVFKGSPFLFRRQASSKTRRESQTMSQRRTRASLPSRLSEPIAGSAKKRHGYEVFARKPTLLSKGSPTETSKEAGTAAKVKVLERRLLFLQPSFRVVRRMVPGSISVSRRTWALTTTCDRDLHACPSQVARVQTRFPPKSD